MQREGRVRLLEVEVLEDIVEVRLEREGRLISSTWMVIVGMKEIIVSGIKVSMVNDEGNAEDGVVKLHAC